MLQRKLKSSRTSSSVKTTEEANPGLLDAIFASATEYALITTNKAGKIATWNKGAELVFGYSAKEIVDKPIAEIFTAEDRINGEAERELAMARTAGRSSDLRWHQRKDGTCFWADGVMTPIKNADNEITGYLKILRDETERKLAQNKLEELARIDILTGVANRASFQERLAEMSAAALRNHELLILHLVDLDNFKQVNDKWGHQCGDRLLQQMVQRMREVSRNTDFVARLGGDEFVILQSDVQDPESGGALAEKLVDALSRPYHIDGHEIMTGVSIGIALFPQDAANPDQLLRKADLALYKVKNGGRNGYHYFSEQLDTDAHKKGRVLAALKSAVKSHLFWLEYQPEIDAASGRTVAVEALLRCRDPLLASYNIGEIIGLATESGLMPEIGIWVMAEACAQSKKWRDAGLPHIKMCINLCPRELQASDFTKNVSDILERSNLSAQDLEIEITEHEVFESSGQSSATVAHLRSLGISVAIDDFGAGYSSLGKLRNLPIDKLKLDPSFLRKVPSDPESCAFVSAMISLAHTMKLGVIAEGVESAEQAAFFEREHCDALQGNFFSPPMKVGAMTDWLSRQLH
ncbi:MAG TPA: EAL domain-containing protein [Burkholderiaceae bacterium]|jgi:diguanylate cyclase (GGDEF)-like protein/PAS domain S-box-containing protein